MTDLRDGRLSRRANRAVSWLKAQQRHDGSYSAEPLTLQAYYKSLACFAVAGEEQAAKSTLGWIKQSYLTGSGYLIEPSPPARGRHSDLYESLWVLWGATLLNESLPTTLALALRHQDPLTGGVRSHVEGTRTDMWTDLRSTALAGIALLAVGDITAAERCALYAMDLLKVQDCSKPLFYIVRSADGNLVTDFAAEEARYFVVTARGDRPLFYALGFSVALLALMYRATNDERYLLGSRQYVEVTRNFGAAALASPYSGKFAWGASLLYQVTEQSLYKRLARQVYSRLAREQSADGRWPAGPATGDWSASPWDLDRTAEYAIWFMYGDRLGVG